MVFFPIKTMFINLLLKANFRGLVLHLCAETQIRLNKMLKHQRVKHLDPAFPLMQNQTECFCWTSVCQIRIFSTPHQQFVRQLLAYLLPLSQSWTMASSGWLSPPAVKNMWSWNFFFPSNLADYSHPHSPPEVPEGGRPWHHEGGDPRGGADRGRRWDRPRRDGAEERPDPLVQRSEPHPDAGMCTPPGLPLSITSPVSVW